MSPASLGTVLREARTARDLSLHAVADRARCSAGYVHKLESDRVRTPSPRVLARLAAALDLPYPDLMSAAGYQGGEGAPANELAARVLPVAPARYSNAHIVELLETLLGEVRELRSSLGARS